MIPPSHIAHSSEGGEASFGGIGNRSHSQQRYESLLSMRKHRSLDGTQFLSQFDHPLTSDYAGKKLSVPSYAQFSHKQAYFADYDPQQFSSTMSAASPGFSAYDSYYNAQQRQKYAACETTNFSPYYTDSQNSCYLTHQPRERGYLPSGSYTTLLDSNTIPVYENGILNERPQNAAILATMASAAATDERMDHQPHSLSTQIYQPYVHPERGLSKGMANNYPSATTASTHDYEMLKREFVTVNQKLSYVMNSIRTFWSPELKKERQLRKEDALRINAHQYKLSQQASEVQRVRNELEKREKEIAQLLSESDLGDMEQELRLLRKQIRGGSGEPPPRDFTDKTPTMHELQTAKAKMERSELTLSEKSRELQNCEMRLKCAEEQTAELEKRSEILTRTNAANEAQLKLLHDDLDVLRRKLETKNQQLENREKSIQNVEKELELAKTKVQQHLRTIQENEHQIGQLTHRIDQLETLLRDRESLADRLKQRLMQSPDTRAEADLQQRLENVEKDKSALQKAVDALRQSSDVEKQNQLHAFQEETRQLRSTIEHLQKELSDRHILIVSQNEKISQLDAELGLKLILCPIANNTSCSAVNYFSTSSTLKDCPSVQLFGKLQEDDESNRIEDEHLTSNDVSVVTSNSTDDKQTTQLMKSFTAQNDAMTEIEEARNEIGRLLSIVHQLEKEKNALCVRLNNLSITTNVSTARILAEGKDASTTSQDAALGRDSDVITDIMPNFISTSSTSTKTENSALRLRIEALEEALRESVGITSERDRLINEQKQLVQQLSNQITELYKNCGGRDLQKLLQNALGRTENAEKSLRDERTKFQKQLSSLRNSNHRLEPEIKKFSKEVAMAVIREKDSCIQLLQGPPESLREKVDILVRQREQLKHRLLTTTGINNALPLVAAGTTSVQESFGDLAAGIGGLYNNSQNVVPAAKASSALELDGGKVSLYHAEGGGLRQFVPHYEQQKPTSLYGLMNQSQHSSAVQPPPPYTASSLVPINISVPSYGTPNVGFSAPASLNYGKKDVIVHGCLEKKGREMKKRANGGFAAAWIHLATLPPAACW